MSADVCVGGVSLAVGVWGMRVRMCARESACVVAC